MSTTIRVDVTHAGYADGPGIAAHLFETFNDDRTLINIATRTLPNNGHASAAEQIEAAILVLREARDLLRDAGAPNATDAVRHALKSAEGALRHHSRSDVIARQPAR